MRCRREINTPSIHDLTFAGNDIHTHQMWGVTLDSNPVDVARVSFLDNKLYDNGRDPAYLGVDIGNFPGGVMTESGDCHSAGCAATAANGEITAASGATVVLLDGSTEIDRLIVP